MTPSIASSTLFEAPPSMDETAEIMASNLTKAIEAAAYDFRSDTVTG
jgi:hypothetical protein